MNNAPQSIWNEEAVSKLKSLVPLGITYGEIASRMGGAPFTKKACIGKAHRLGLSNGRPRGPNDYSALPKAAKLARKEQIALANGLVITEDVPMTPTTKREPEEFVPLATIETVTDALCKWPLGESHARMPVCGRPRMPPHRYCEPHFNLSHNR